jgi:hypothetical protein
MRILALIVFAIASSEIVVGQPIKKLDPAFGQLIELSPDGEKQYKKTEGIDLGYYDFVAFSFYDFKVSSSSQLKSDTISYSADNVFDNSYKTAWVEGASGHGVGESIVIEIPADIPITNLVFVGGFARSEELWKENSRPKTIEMFVNNRSFATLNLQDVRQEQCFRFDEDDWSQFETDTWVIKFRIADVYKGMHDRTAITAIYLGGCK